MDLRQLFLIVITLLTAGAYFYFNWLYFSFVRAQMQMPSLRVSFVLICFVINFLLFTACTALELHLISNWSIFAVALFGETVLYTGGDKRCSLFSTLTGIICGLAVNISCRAIIAVITNQPLRDFDNHVYYSGNIKGVPVFLGFLLAGVAVHLLIRPVYMEHLRLILRYPQHQAFLLELMAGLFLYLFLNLILYSAPFNDLLLKCWSLNSCLFSMTGYYIALRYTWRICVLTNYQEENLDMEHALNDWEEIVPQLQRDAVCDPLTGLYNRQYAEEVLASLYEESVPFVLGFADLDDLKTMNDVYGHEEGDRYLKTVTDQLRQACRRDEDLLFRYGGDEFLILVRDVSADTVERRLEAVNAGLARKAEEAGFRRPISISYGVVESGECSKPVELIASADRKMYEQKKQKQSGGGVSQGSH